jgi:sarcosine oxidase
MAEHYDAIVVGVGGMGSAAVYHLARRGKRVLGLERFDVPHEMGSSHGVTRIIRLAYYEDPGYVPLLRRAYELWRELQVEAGEQLLHITGSLDAGPAGSEVPEGSLLSCRLHELPHELLDAAEIGRRFPAYQLPKGHVGVLQPEGAASSPSWTARRRSAPRCTRASRSSPGRRRATAWSSAPSGRPTRPAG